MFKEGIRHDYKYEGEPPKNSKPPFPEERGEKMKVKIKESDSVEVFDKRSGAITEIKGKVVRIKEGETLGTEWREILLNSGYKIVLR